MVVRDLKDLETYHQDNENSLLYEKDSFTAEDFGYAVILTTFILIVVLVCIVGLAITTPCCCRGNKVHLCSSSYPNPSCVLKMPTEEPETSPLNYKPL